MDKYNLKKKKNQVLTKYIKPFITSNTWGNIMRCGNFISFIADETLTRKKWNYAESCNNRFCPLCSYRQTKKDAMKVYISMKWIIQEHKKDFIFLTLTVPNVSGEKLPDTLNKLNLGWKNMAKRADVAKVNRGYARKLEITYNKDENTYHPHYHIIMAVNKSYFKSRDYLAQSKWLKMWQEAMNDPTITQVHVKKINPTDTHGEVAEIAKYSAKDSDYLQSEQIFETFYKALKHRHVLAFNGLFKAAIKKYKLHELDYLMETDDTQYIYSLLYRWGQGEYVLLEQRLLSATEELKANKNKVDEMEIENE